MNVFDLLISQGASLTQGYLGSAQNFLGSPAFSTSGLDRTSPVPINGGLLARMSARRDPLFSIDWQATIIGAPGDDGEPIDNIYIESIQVPSIRIDNKPVYREGSTLNYAGAFSTDNSRIVLYNDHSGNAARFATSWLNSVYDFETGNYRTPKQYKKQIVVTFKDANQSDIFHATLTGCWPTSFNQLELNSKEASLLPIEMDLSVDSCHYYGL
jgi:hypothetical protein